MAGATAISTSGTAASESSSSGTFPLPFKVKRGKTPRDGKCNSRSTSSGV